MKDLVLSRLRYATRLRLSKIFNRSFFPPVEVLFTLTNRCNLRCIMCNFKKIQANSADELNTEQVTSIITQIADLKIETVVFSGGEPLLRDDLFEIVNFASRHGIANTILLTNGTIIDEEIIKRINESGLKAVWISLVGFDLGMKFFLVHKGTDQVDLGKREKVCKKIIIA